MPIQPPGTPTRIDRASRTAQDMYEAAVPFLAALSPEQKRRVLFPVEDGERLNWDYRPRERSGLPLRDMDNSQQKLALSLLSSGLSRRANIQALQIMSLEKVLRGIEGSSEAYRNPDSYYLTLFGGPSTQSPWGWRLEGHHVSINVLVVDGREIAPTPNFLGANPARVPEGPLSGFRVLAAEEDLARRLLSSLNPGQFSRAVIDEAAPHDIVTGMDPRVNVDQPVGLSFYEMDDSQRTALSDLISEYVSRLPNDLSDAYLDRIEKEGKAHIHFAWAGKREAGEPHYYRIHGPSFFVEYDNTQNNANHIHTVWRDIRNDWGDDLMKRHYASAHQPM